MTAYIDLGARISKCGLYRDLLWRRWGSRHRRQMVIIGLNPSTADATKDDPTIRRDVGFAQREGCSGLYKANLYAFRATEPDDCRAALSHAVGPTNDPTIRELFRLSFDRDWPVVAAWGAAEWAEERAKAVTLMAKAHGVQLLCLGITKSGAPRHPLYVKGDTPLVPWP